MPNPHESTEPSDAGLDERLRGELATTTRFAQHLVSELIAARARMAPGDPTPCAIADVGGPCAAPAMAVRSESGFAVAVCERRAATARSRGAMVVFPKRHIDESD